MIRTFVLYRDVDVSGVSGTGVVAEGAEFSDGKVVVRWLTGDDHSTVVWDKGMESVIKIHGHGGHTRIVWLKAHPILPVGPAESREYLQKESEEDEDRAVRP